MHEMGVAQQMINIALASIPADIVNPRVERLNLKVGKLAAVVEDSLKFCFEIIAKDSLLEGAELVIEHVPVKVRCKNCQAIWEVDGPVFSCQSCKDGMVEIISGRELEIVSIEIAE
ncbi:MAG: hydrogenase maturation nickel metallochaperone HypA [Desulfamplus sp.]|nr:hydrogenase maturation nickel metallochaperone HypA [Desulfamplus sp.]MBF0413753.1 hydrogenase maturation nickel metallochaperone HypA [Desulfamplus sp.]